MLYSINIALFCCSISKKTYVDRLETLWYVLSFQLGRISRPAWDWLLRYLPPLHLLPSMTNVPYFRGPVVIELLFFRCLSCSIFVCWSFSYSDNYINLDIDCFLISGLESSYRTDSMKGVSVYIDGFSYLIMVASALAMQHYSYLFHISLIRETRLSSSPTFVHFACSCPLMLQLFVYNYVLYR